MAKLSSAVGSSATSRAAGEATTLRRVVRFSLWFVTRVLIIAEILVLVAVVAVAGAMHGAYKGVQPILPEDIDFANYQPPTASRIYAANGELLAILFDEDIGYREIATLEEVPLFARQAVVAVEDRRFYQHQGVDLPRIARVAYDNWQSRRITAGASTLTQQVARRLFLTEEAKYGRKVQEAYIALHLERNFSKDEILELYLNLMGFGHPAYGIKAAAKLYFDKDLGELTVDEGALLGGLVQDPERRSPWRNPEGAVERRNEVLDDMARDGYITAAEAEEYKAKPLKLAERGELGLFSYRAPYFVTYCVEELVRRYGYDRVYKGGMQVYTTMVPEVQAHTQEAIIRGVERARGYRCSQAATVVMEPNTGDILALVGGTGFTSEDQNNRAVQAQRQPGSSFKPFVYTAAIEAGYTPGTGISGSTITFRAGPGEYWTVKSNGGGGTLASALAGSVNAASARLVYKLGPSRVIEVAHRMGIDSNLEPVLSIALGTEEVTPLEMTRAFACFANGGFRVEPTTIDRVYDHDGILIDEPAPRRERALAMYTANVMVEMLKGVVRYGTGTAAQGLGVPTAGKTGSTDDHRDAWFMGVTPQFVVGVWAGNDTGFMAGGAFGGRVCAPIFKDIAQGTLEIIGAKPDLEFPGPGDERIRKKIASDPALTMGGDEEETEETAASATQERPIVDLSGAASAPAGGGGGGSVPSYVRTPSAGTP